MHPKTNKFLSCVLANTGEQNGAALILLKAGRRVWCDRLKQARTTFWPWYINIVKNALGLFAQGENVSAVPPVFRVWLCTLSVLIYCVPVTWNWRWSLLGMSVRVYESSDWICGLVHCSGATSTIRSRKLAPTAFSLCFPGLCTPPCHGIWLI